jgi:hypothetical protein
MLVNNLIFIHLSLDKNLWYFGKQVINSSLVIVQLIDVCLFFLKKNFFNFCDEVKVVIIHKPI